MTGDGAPGSPGKKLSPLTFAVIVAVALSAIYAYRNQEKIFNSIKKEPTQQPVEESIGETSPLVPQAKLNPLETLRIATWDLTPLDFMKLGDQARANQIVETIMGFDVVAIQGVTARNMLPVDELIQRLEAKQRHYAYAAYPDSLGRVPEYMVFLFDKATVRIDRETLKEVNDPSLTYRPLVASFCAAKPPQEKTFTFMLLSVKVNDQNRENEVKALGNLYRDIRDRHFDEDDLMMLGNFGEPVGMIFSLRNVANLTAVHSDYPTTADATNSVDNLLFDNLRTTEYVGRFGVIDLMTKYNLKIADVYPLANHLPVCAEFSIFESGKAE